MPPISVLVRSRPASWLGQPIVWQSLEPPVPVFMDEIPLRDGSRSAFLFGTRYDLAEALVGGQDYAPGFFAEYFVVVGNSGKWQVHRLIQNGSVTYSNREERKDYVPATHVGFGSERRPKWKVSEAVWPLCDGKPMRFVGQVLLDKTKFKDQCVPTGISVYLFEADEGGEDCFKIVTQNAAAQTAEEHYRDEAIRESRAGKTKSTKRRFD